MHRWILASRPKTLTAAISPVILGSSLAFYEGYFSTIIFIVILITATLIQIGTNFSNDLFDPFSSNLLNMEYGILISGFKVSYRWVNLNLTGTKVNNSVNSSSYSIQPIRHLEVVWQFLN